MKNKIIIIIVGLMLSISTIAFVNKNDTSSLIGAYIDGEYSSTIPGKDDGYVVEKIDCDNDATGKWDYSEWGILTTNMTKKSKCNIYFKKGIRLADVNTYVDDTGKCPTVNSDGTVNVTGAESENSLLCSAPDNYGTSYYYRGNVQNNYVKFANFYWRIVRINGDGSIRLIYDGTSAHQNGEESEDRIIGKSAFNEKSDDNAYVGYMYGTTGSSTYEETHANINDSTIKKYVDSWYENNLKNTSYEKYIYLDSGFCGDRSLINYDEGIGTIFTMFAAIERIRNNVPTLNCSNFNNDNYTLINSSSKGNNSLINPIALLSVDEIMMSGLIKTESANYNSFLTIKNVYYYTMTPSIFDHGSNYTIGDEWYVDYNGTLQEWNNLSSTRGVKPVINLKPNSLKFGDGTINNPYTVE